MRVDRARRNAYYSTNPILQNVHSHTPHRRTHKHKHTSPHRSYVVPCALPHTHRTRPPPMWTTARTRSSSAPSATPSSECLGAWPHGVGQGLIRVWPRALAPKAPAHLEDAGQALGPAHARGLGLQRAAPCRAEGSRTHCELSCILACWQPTPSTLRDPPDSRSGGAVWLARPAGGTVHTAPPEPDTPPHRTSPAPCLAQPKTTPKCPIFQGLHGADHRAPAAHHRGQR